MSTQNEAHKVLGALCRLQCSFSGVFTFDIYQHGFVLLLLLLRNRSTYPSIRQSLSLFVCFFVLLFCSLTHVPDSVTTNHRDVKPIITKQTISSVQFKMVSMRSQNTIHAPPTLSGVSPTLPLKQFQCSSD